MTRSRHPSSFRLHPFSKPDARDYEIRIWYSAEKGDECFVAQVVESSQREQSEMDKRSAAEAENREVRVNRASGKRCDMDKRSAAESRELGSSSQKVGNASDLDLLQKTFDRMK